MATLSANDRRQAVRNAVLHALKAQGKSCSAMTGKLYVSALTNEELRTLANTLGVNCAAAIAAAEQAPVPPAPATVSGLGYETEASDFDAPESDAPQPIAASDATPAAQPSPSDRAWQALQPLQPLRGLLSESVLDGLVDNVSRIYATLDASREELEASRARPLVTPAKDGEAIETSAELFSASKLFGVRSSLLSSIKLPVWNSPAAPAIDPYYVWPRELLEELCVCTLEGSYPWLYGPKGTGKTSAAEQLAARLGRGFHRIAFNSYTEPRDLFGGYGLKDGATVWRDGPLTKAIREQGAIILLDEPTLGRPGCHAALQTLLDHNYIILESGERVDVARGVLFIAADNTNGRGDESGLYSGTMTLNAAYLDRFSVMLKVEHPSAAQETEALAHRTGAPKALAGEIIEFANKTRAKCANGDLVEGVGFRRLAAFTKRLMAGVPLERAYETAILNAAHGEDVAALSVMASADLDKGLIERALKGEETQGAPAPAQPAEYRDARNARAAQDFSA